MTIDFNGFEAPNHTQTPNEFFDSVLPKIEYFSELKVILAIIRQTYGWHKKEDRISLSQLQKLTGMKRQVVHDGVKYALEHGYIERRQEGQNFYYRLKLVTQIDQSPQVTSNPRLLELVTQTDQQLVTPGDPQKKDINKYKEKEHAANAAPIPFKNRKEKECEEESQAVKRYRDTFRKTPTPAQRKLIDEKVTDLDKWQQNLDEWSLSGWNPLNVNGMISRYVKSMEKNGTYHAIPDPNTLVLREKLAKRNGKLLD